MRQIVMQRPQQPIRSTVIQQLALMWIGLGVIWMINCGDEPAVQESPLYDPAVIDLPVDEPVAAIDTDVPNAQHPIAGRSAFPERDEQLASPIKPERLSKLDQFAEPIAPTNIPAIIP